MHPLPLSDNCLIQGLFSRCAVHVPDALAVTDDNQAWNYRELDEYSDKIARFLVSEGIKSGDLVAISIERSADFVALVLGILKSGAAFVPIDTDYPVARKVHMVTDSEAKLLIASEYVLSSLSEQSVSCFVYEEIKAAINTASSTGGIVSNADSATPAYVIYTSGTTGKPKGVVVQHRQLANLCSFYAGELYPISQEDRVLFRAPTSFDASITEFLWPLCFGASVHVIDQKHQADTNYLVNFIKSQKITFATFVPSLLTEIIDHPNIDQCEHLRMVLCGGEAMPPDLPGKLSQKIPAALINMYGPTETTVDATYFKCAPDVIYRSVPIGRPISNAQIYLLDEHMEPVSQGEIGEIYIGGQGVAKGYLNQPVLTGEKFLPDPFSPIEGRMYKTGDLGRLSKDGNIEFAGRNDQQIKINGYRIECTEIESILLDHEKIARVFVTTFDNDDINQLVAYLIAEPGPIPGNFELRYLLGKHLPHYMIPQHFVYLDKFPLTANEKIDSKALPDPNNYMSGADHRDAENEIERQLAGFWSAVLSVNPVGRDSNFFFLGGDSISAAQVIGKIESEYSVEYSLIDFYTYSTLLEMAGSVQKLLEAKEKTEDSLIRQLLDEIEMMDAETVTESLAEAETNFKK